MKKKYWLASAFTYISPLLKEQFFTFLCIIVSSIIQQQYPLVLKIIVDDVIINQNQKMFAIMLSIYIGLFFISFLFGFITNLMNTLNIQYFSFRIKNSLFTQLQNASMNYLHKTKIGDIVSTFNVDINTISNFLSKNFLNMLTNIFNIIVVISIMLMLNWQLSFFVVLILPFFYLSILMTNGYIKGSLKNRRRLVSVFNNFLQNVFSNVIQMKLLAGERFFKKKFLITQDNVIKTELKVTISSSLLNQLSNLVILMGNTIIIGYGVSLVFSNRLSIGGLIAFYTYMPLLFGPIRNLVTVTIQLKDFRIAFQKILNVLDIEKETDAEPSSLSHNRIRISGNIDFQNISFAYNDDKEPVLKNISFCIRHGEKIAIIGRNGSGKTTLVNLLLKLYPLTNGEILINNLNINKINNKLLRKHIGIVTQKVNFFNMSIKENYKLAFPAAKDSDIDKVCQYTGASEFIKELPEGYDTIIGESGYNFSGGQLQKLAISQLILKDPDIIIFDEATSSLDPESIQLFYNLFTDVFKEKTVLFILHDLKRLIYADRAVLLKNGCIEREYTQNDLLNEKDIFQALSQEVKGSS